MFKKLSSLFKRHKPQMEFKIPSQAEFQSAASYKNFAHLKDERLYEDNEYCLNFLKNNASKPLNLEIISGELKPNLSVNSSINLKSNLSQNAILPKSSTKFHAYWYGLINEKHAFCIKSFLATQENAKLYLWLDESTFAQNEQNPILQALKRYIYIYIYAKEGNFGHAF